MEGGFERMMDRGEELRCSSLVLMVGGRDFGVGRRRML